VLHLLNSRPDIRSYLHTSIALIRDKWVLFSDLLYKTFVCFCTIFKIRPCQTFTLSSSE